MDCYAVLEVPPTATTATIRSAFRDLAQKWHPDKNSAPTAEATQRMSEINLAWEILKNAETRKLYDQAIATGSSWLPAKTGPWTPRRADTPKMHEVNSGCVLAVGHDGSSNLYIEFRTGGLYVYRGVPIELFASLIHARSPGRFVIYNIVSGPYQCKRVGA